MRNPYDFDEDQEVKSSRRPPPRAKFNRNLLSRSDSDAIVQQTNDDASISRESAVALGYMQDPYSSAMVKQPSRRAPIINRGTYLRTKTIDSLVKKFVEHPDVRGRAQVVSLGAGSDTRYFRLRDEGMEVQRYFEVDFGAVTARKVQTMKAKSELFGKFMEHVEIMSETEVHSPKYYLLEGDLREWETLMKKLLEFGFDKSLPTLWLSECVLIYLEPEDGDRIVEWVGRNMSHAAFVTYEPFRPFDPFGQVMIRNLSTRGIVLKAIHVYHDEQQQKQRYLTRGFNSSHLIDMKHAFDERVDAVEKQRLAKLEMVDEVEEWDLLGSHYFVLCASKGVSVDPHLLL